MNWLKKGRRQFIIFGITILFAAFLIQLNQVEREGLYETEGKTFEKAKVVEIKKDNTTGFPSIIKWQVSWNSCGGCQFFRLSLRNTL